MYGLNGKFKQYTKLTVEEEKKLSLKPELFWSVYFGKQKYIDEYI